VRRWLRSSCLAVSIASIAVFALAGPAAGGPAPVENSLTIVKTVEGPVPEGTTFTVTVECTNDVIDDGDGGTDSATVEFDADGQPTTDDVIDLVFGVEAEGVCTVTETVDGGAESTTYACEGVSTASPAATAVAPICPEAGPVEDDIVVNKSYPAIDATVTVHNTFVAAPTTTTTTKPPAPAPSPAAVVAKPTFTG
jgi:hypothetical protein